MTAFFRRYLLPGFVFQSVVIGGGYATGRELVQFFLPAGPWGGLLGMAVTMAVWSLVLAASFELARLTRSYDYKSFFTVLLGRGWFLFEIAYLALLVLVLSVVGAAAGEISSQLLDTPRAAGTLAMMACIGLLVFYGSAIVEKALAASAFALYVVYFILIAWCLSAFGGRIAGNFAQVPVTAHWLTGGLTYAGYNVAIIPSVFFCVRHLASKRETIGAGLLAGPLAMLPGILFYVAMMSAYPGIGDQPVPSNYLLGLLGARWFQWLFQLAVFWTLVATGTGLIHAINERVAKIYEARGRSMPAALRPAIALVALAVSVYAAGAFGLVALIARGYGLLTYAFLAILVAPMLTVGVWKIGRLWRVRPAASRALLAGGPNDATWMSRPDSSTRDGSCGDAQ